MRKALRNTMIALLLSGLFFPLPGRAANDVMGELQFEGKSHVEKTSGVWVDGEYVGYLKELKGSKKVLLLPGQHTIVVRQDGYKDFTREVTLRPGEEHLVNVALEKAITGPVPAVTSTVIISADPSRAAVFIDGQYIGHVGEFRGWGRALLVAPGAHRIRIALPGYESFEADINPRADQKVEIKTDLLKSSRPVADALLKTGEAEDASSPAAPSPASQDEGVLPNAMASPTGK
jgi:PEGA domain